MVGGLGGSSGVVPDLRHMRVLGPESSGLIKYSWKNRLLEVTVLVWCSEGFIVC